MAGGELGGRERGAPSEHVEKQLQVALTKFQERAARLEQQRAEIDRAIAELARASLEIQAMLAARAKDEE